ncbi:MAG: hypothetical protein IJV91_04435 [Kiritimatiellae bacterium]|nr:hypothetical protein [Kiritimatiellia bacterium]
MIKLLKHLTKREWRFAFCVLVLIVAQVWLDLKMPDYMNAITQIASGSSGIQGRVSGQMSDIYPGFCASICSCETQKFRFSLEKRIMMS